ncbi:enoyl-CoA hydratase/isomerase family protein [Saccharopolyspora erythraea]|uniref:enoyl-CoA hydratase/isomerase family protein n=1 Tax=Saccharopolyspora erythraea TaxID=1836 RepID=UPI001BA65E8C|nr:enoyl-CoA hydratase/isomerase family protein [Saccharopolyspora erythraea]QUH04190.1 enoyl-CoA hydratase/isomerase family protein [Saccharopolyspora erythraea]
MTGTSETTAAEPISTNGSVTLSYSHDGLVATLTIDRPAKLNALTLEMLDELERRLGELAVSSARVVLVRTAGTKVFCVGADISAFSQLSAADMWRRWISDGHRVFDRLARLRQPTIAVVDGLAVGGGLELALACDFRLAGRHARFGLPEVGLGTIPGWGGTERLTQLVGASRAKQLILTRRQIDATVAEKWGLVNDVAADELDTEVERYVNDLLGSAPIAQQVAKQLVDAAAAGAPSAIVETIASGFTSYTDDFAEGVQAFMNKSAPDFRGR